MLLPADQAPTDSPRLWECRELFPSVREGMRLYPCRRVLRVTGKWKNCLCIHEDPVSPMLATLRAKKGPGNWTMRQAGRNVLGPGI